MLLNEGVVAVLIILAVIMLVLLMMGYPMMVPLAVGTLYMMFTGLTFFGPDQAVSGMISGVGSGVLAAHAVHSAASMGRASGRHRYRLCFYRHSGTPCVGAVLLEVYGTVGATTTCTCVPGTDLSLLKA